jgi:flagellar basal body-associated protein FliL
MNMAKKLKMKSSVKIGIIAFAAVLCVALIFFITNRSQSESVNGDQNNPAQAQTEENNSSSQAQAVQNEGDIEIIIPEDQESGGF